MILAPAPVSLRIDTGSCPVPDAPRVLLAGEFFNDWEPKGTFDRFLSQAGALTRREWMPAASGGHAAWLELIEDRELCRPEEYVITITLAGVTIRAGKPRGAAHALRTLLQVIRQHPAALPCLEIRDWPALAERGVMLDISRCKVPTLDTLRALVDRLAEFKVNRLQLYTEHTFAFRDHALVWGDSSPLTDADVRLLDQWCHERDIELVPNLNSFGHFERWLRHPEYRHLSECPDGFTHPLASWIRHPGGSTLCPDDASLAFVDSLYAEFLPNFRSKTLNIGGDETWDLGQGRSRGRCEREGKHAVYLDFLGRIAGTAASHGRKVQFWADIVLESPEVVARLPEDITGMVWGYEAGHPFASQCATFAKAGIPYQVVPGTSSWNSLAGRPEVAFPNIDEAARQAVAHGAQGLLVTDWGDNGHHQPLIAAWPALLHGACVAWNPSGNAAADIPDRLSTHVFNDTTGRLARALIDLGRVLPRSVKAIRNQSLVFRLLFDPAGPRLDDALAGIDVQDLESALERLDACTALASGARPRSADARILREEFESAADLVRCALLRGLQTLAPSPARQRELRTRLTCAINRFESTWLLRNRVGGLHESSSRLRAMQA